MKSLLDLLKRGPELVVEGKVVYDGNVKIFAAPHPPAACTYDRRCISVTFTLDGQERKKDIYDIRDKHFKVGQKVMLTLQRWVFGEYSVRNIKPLTFD